MNQKNSGPIRLAIGAAIFVLLCGAGSLSAGEVVKSYEFVVDEWHEIDQTDGPVTLHRIRLDRKEDRLNKSTLARPHNLGYLETVRFQLEYTNGSSQKWKARVEVRWLDDDGKVIDGYGANETLAKKSAKKITQASISTLKYGLQKAKTFEVKIRYEP